VYKRQLIQAAAAKSHAEMKELPKGDNFRQLVEAQLQQFAQSYDFKEFAYSVHKAMHQVLNGVLV